MSSDLKVTNIKHASSSSNNLVLASDGNVSITNTLSAGTIGSGVNFPSTMIRQVKVTTTDTVTSTTSSSFTDVTGMSVNITPTSDSSKIFLLLNFRFANSTSSNNTYQILRNSTALDLGGGTGNLGNFNVATFIDTETTLLDTHGVSAGTQVTYKLQVKRSAGTLYINSRFDGGNERNGSIIAMEVL